MKKTILISVLIILITLQSPLFAQPKSQIEYVSEFKNSNLPQVGYWFLTPEIMENEKYLKDLDEMIDHSLFDFIFLDARNGCSFGNLSVMHPALEKIVAQAYKRNIKIGYRI